MGTWEGLLEEHWIRRIDETPFLSSCREGRAKREDLHSFVRQQYYYARHFTRYLCALLANLIDENDRNELARNLWEEMGLGGLGDRPHAELYRDMMSRMGVEAASEDPSPQTRELVERMLEHCRNPDPLVGLGALCLGAEAIVPHVYAQIVTGFREAGEPEENLEFFRIHIEEDDKHSETMRRVIMKSVGNDPNTRERVRRAAYETLEARARFFEGIGQSGRENVAV